MKSGGGAQPLCPIFIVKSSGIDVNEVLSTLTVGRNFFPCVDCQTWLAGFQLLYQHRGGILALELKGRKEYLAFHRTLSALVKVVNALTVRVLIFSNSTDVLDSRTLAQFQFIRCFQMPRQSSRFAEILLRESRSLTQNINLYEQKQVQVHTTLPKTPLLLIRGSKEKPTFNTIIPRDPVKKNPLSYCVGPEVPTYLYGAELSWRVRGYFSKFDAKNGVIVFTANSDGAQKKLLSQLSAGPVLLSSSSRPEGKICSALEFIGVDEKEFRFRFPKITKVIQRRASQRRRVNPLYQSLIRWHDTEMRADRLFAVFDYGTSGVGFLIPEDQTLDLRKDKSLGPLFIYSHGREIEIEKAVVRHISKSETHRGSQLVGIEFQQVASRFQAFIEMLVFTGTL